MLLYIQKTYNILRKMCFEFSQKKPTLPEPTNNTLCILHKPPLVFAGGGVYSNLYSFHAIYSRVIASLPSNRYLFANQNEKNYFLSVPYRTAYCTPIALGSDNRPVQGTKMSVKSFLSAISKRRFIS